jgi:isopropylmalate/homocitrate/citramalate synthase
MGVANTINAVLAGGEVIHTTVLGIGERAGNTPMEETVLALLTMYGIDVGIDYSKMNEVSKLVQELAGVEVPTSRPFIGEGAYNIESGIVTGWYKNVFETNPTTVFPVRPDFVGHEVPRILMGKKSGLDNVAIWGKKLGIELNDEEAMDVLQEVKLKSHDLKRVLTEEEFMQIAEKVRSGS